MFLNKFKTICISFVSFFYAPEQIQNNMYIYQFFMFLSKFKTICILFISFLFASLLVPEYECVCVCVCVCVCLRANLIVPG